MTRPPFRTLSPSPPYWGGEGRGEVGNARPAAWAQLGQRTAGGGRRVGSFPTLCLWDGAGWRCQGTVGAIPWRDLEPVPTKDPNRG